MAKNRPPRPGGYPDTKLDGPPADRTGQLYPDDRPAETDEPDEAETAEPEKGEDA